MRVSWSDLAIGDCLRLVGFEEKSNSYQKNLLALGLVPRTQFVVKHIAPLGDPIAIEVRGALLSLRKEEASQLMIERFPSDD